MAADTGTRTDLVDAVRAVTTALCDEVQLDELLHLVAERTCALVGVARCSIHLRDEHSDTFRGQVGHAGHDIDSDVKRLVTVPGDRFTQEIVASRRPVLLSDPLGDPRAIRAAMREWEVTAVLGVPMVLHDDVIGIMYLDNEEVPHAYGEADQAVAATFADLAATAIRQAQQTRRLRDTLATVARQNQLLKRATQMEERLATRLLEGSSVAEIGRAVATLTGQPCAILDAHFEPIAECPAEGDREPVPRLLGAATRAMPAVAEVLEALDDRASARVLDPLPQAGLRHRLMVAAIDVRSERWGYLVVVERARPLDSADALLAGRAARNIALQLSATRRAAGDDWPVGEPLALGLLRGDADAVSLQQRADMLGARLDVPRVVCLVRARVGPGPQPGLPPARQLAEALGGASHHRPIAANLPGETAVLLGIDAVRDRVARVLEEIAPGGGLFAALSSTIVAPPEYPPAYGDAVEVMRCLEGYVRDAGNHVLAADDLGPAQLFLSAAGGERGSRFAHATLGPLLDPGNPRSGELLETLAAFLQAAHSVRVTAEALSIHKNTVRYRLTRIHELTGLDVVEDTDAQVAAHMSLTVLRLSGHHLLR